VTDGQTDRPTDHAARSVTICRIDVRITAKRRNNSKQRKKDFDERPHHRRDVSLAKYNANKNVRVHVEAGV